MTHGEDVGQRIREAWDAFLAANEEPSPEAFDALADDVHARFVAPDPERGFWGLVWLLRTQPYPLQNLAGEVLTRHEVPCRASLDELLAVVRDNANPSARLTAHYLEAAFGKARVLEAVRRMAAEGVWSEEERQRFDGFVYNLGEWPGSFLRGEPGPDEEG